MSTPESPKPAIPAAKNAIGDILIYWLFARWSLWSFFHRVWLQTVGPLPEPQRGPFIFYLNHSSWWDAYLLIVLHHLALGRRFDSYVMQEEKQLRAFRFFTWCGAFSVNRHDPEDIARAQQYAANLLRGQPKRALFIFPQGKIVPNDQRPLVTYAGVARIVALAPDVTLCPVALRYELLGQQWPHAFMRIGPAHRPSDPGNIAQTHAEVTANLTAAVDALRDDVVANRRTFRPMLRGRRGIDETFAAFLKLLPNKHSPQKHEGAKPHRAD